MRHHITKIGLASLTVLAATALAPNIGISTAAMTSFRPVEVPTVVKLAPQPSAVEAADTHLKANFQLARDSRVKAAEQARAARLQLESQEVAAGLQL